MPSAKNLSAKIEALLFIYGESLTLQKIAKTLAVSEEEVAEALKVLEVALSGDDSGLFLVHDKEKVQLTTKPEFGSLLETIMKEELRENLTPAALETLSIVAYAGPMTRAEIDYIRGVNSSFSLRNLSIRGLVERHPDPKRGNVYLYNPSFDLLKFLGVAKVEDLPEFERFHQLIEKLRHPEEKSVEETSKEANAPGT
ncbi:MAG: segregation and condensation protein B [Parcubacteria group bacterium Gr01-1014_19]|nr:MAG: segregation and condensation protein B [Parcubacteria group bacterium Gr01-1014_19]